MKVCLLGREETTEERTRRTGHSGDRRSAVWFGGGGGKEHDRKLDRQEAITAGTNEGERRRADWSWKLKS